jgi:hypothetical protein
MTKVRTRSVWGEPGYPIEVATPTGAPLEVADPVVASQLARPSSMAVAVVTSPGAWHDVAIADWVEIDASTIGAGSKLLEIEVMETGGLVSCYLLLRANAAEATTLAWEIPAGSSTSLDLRAGAGITTISVYGSARLKGYLS